MQVYFTDGFQQLTTGKNEKNIPHMSLSWNL